MPQQYRNQNKKQVPDQSSGSKYHEEHAGRVTGYGEIDPIVDGLNHNEDNKS
ncbi:hypothetical protein [Bacillus rubiinfantis]|uniref:hypothetical protein n=1 Tax=Bacillus rubiinfantis TaxID=1499680 RepID=UPI000A6FCBDA|nr:hypothetical protein [Bacillus rubiinfantis]